MWKVYKWNGRIIQGDLVSKHSSESAALKAAKKAIDFKKKVRKESKEESHLIKNYLLKNKISTKIIKINKKLVIKKSMKEARENRYEKLIKYCNRKNILHLFLAHHYNLFFCCEQ